MDIEATRHRLGFALGGIISMTPARPFLKWPGGKRWLVPQLLNLISGIKFKKYFEPFAGGAALFFALQPKRAQLSDINADLVNTYLQVKHRPAEIIRRLKQLAVDRDTYYAMRAEQPDDSVRRAVRFLYLNRTAFGGIYRLNRRGEFNVPFGGGGRSPSILWKRELLVSAARALRNTDLLVNDFQSALDQAGPGDLVYCDPTYSVMSGNNGFTRYNEATFGWEDHERLGRVCRELQARGATVLVSNISHRSVHELFSPCEIHTFRRVSRVCPRNLHRRTVKEEVFVFRAAI